MKKRILSMLLGLVLTVGMIPITSMTAGATTTPNTAVEKVQAMLEALPTVEELKDADEATVNAAYEADQAAYDALEALKPEEQEQITGIEKMTALMDWFNGQVEVLVEQPPASYVDENGETQTCNDYTIVNSSTTTLGDEGKETWYYVDGDVTISGELMAYGDVHLILKDGATLTVNGGVAIKDEAYLDEYNSNLTIYGQENQTGKLVANGSRNGIQIDSYGVLTINGGVVEATGGVNETSGSDAVERQIVTESYGIYGTYVVINSGKVTAIGGTATPYDEQYNATYSVGISVWELRVNGGEVTATGGTATGENGESYGIQADLTITDGMVVAKSAAGKAVVFPQKATLTPPTNYWWRAAYNANYKTQNVQYTDSDLTGTYFELVTTKPANNIEPYVTDAKATVTYGDAVNNGVIKGNTDVEGTFAWKNVTSYGDASATPKKLTATFTPSVSGYVPVDVEVSVTVNKADQVAPTGITNTAETVDGKADGKITGVTSAMEYRKDGDTNYTAITDTEITGLADGKYYVRYKGDANHNASADTEVTIAKGRKLTVTVPTAATQIGYTLTASKTALVWNDSVELTFALANGYSKLDTFAVNVNGNLVTLDANGKYTVTDVQSDITITVVGVMDITAPTGEITLGKNSWKTFLNNITFGLFFKDTQEVTITATDNSGENVKIEYLLSDKELTAEELATATFTAYSDKFNINPNNEYVIYAKLSDKTGNVIYINSNGIVLDSVAPVISGITNGETYCEAQTVIVSDKYEVTVTVNGTPITLDANGQFTLSPANGTQTVVATDKAGNISAEMIVTVNDGHEGGTATCTKKAVCKHCSLEYGEVDNNNHSDLNHIEAKAATTEAEGNIEYWHCEDCNKYFSDKDCKNEITLADTVIAKLTKTDSDNKSPATGDTGNLWMWFALLFVSGVGLLGTTAYKRKRKEIEN